VGKIKKPSTGDRMDNAAEKRFRRQQSDADKALEIAQAKAYNQAVKVAKHRAQQKEKYKGK
jgi:hypothetical protein